MLVNERLSHHDLIERYPSPSESQTIGDPPLLHHGLGFGQTVLCINAVRACLAIAKARGDAVSGDHLRAHLKEYATWKAGRDRHRTAAESARSGRAAIPAAPLP